MADILTLINKMERAYRNGTGFNVKPEEIAALYQEEEDVISTMYAAKLRRMKAKCQTTNTQSGTAGSTSGATAFPPTSGRSPAIPKSLDRPFIEALGLGT